MITWASVATAAKWAAKHWRELGAALALVFFMLWRQAAGALEGMRSATAAAPTASATQGADAKASAGQDLKLSLRPKPQPAQPAAAPGCPECRPCQECPDLDLLLKSFCSGSAATEQTATAKALTLAPSFKAWEVGLGVGHVADRLQPYARGAYFREWTPTLDLGVNLQVFGPWDLGQLGAPGQAPTLGVAADAGLRF